MGRVINTATVDSIAVHVVRVVIIHVIVSLYILHTCGAAGAKGQNARPGEYSSTSADYDGSGQRDNVTGLCKRTS